MTRFKVISTALTPEQFLCSAVFVAGFTALGWGPPTSWGKFVSAEVFVTFPQTGSRARRPGSAPPTKEFMSAQIITNSDSDSSESNTNTSGGHTPGSDSNFYAKNPDADAEHGME